ncbi:MAG: methionyl-tRNA formyltransferase [Colwellia sp.]|jgi:methionyl-tRNA formyltransferase
MKYIVASVGDWNNKLFNERSKNFNGEWFFCDNPDSLDDLLDRVRPRYIFPPHWRWIVPEDIVEDNECVCFHMTDVPYGRGGSPLQNLIIRGHKTTVLTSLRMDEGADTGSVYFKIPFSLDGTAEAIYQRAAELSWDMISEIINNEPNPTSQEGELVEFKRRKPEQSQSPSSLVTEQIYDYIRMLDAPGYPHGFIEKSGYLFEFTGAEFKAGELTANVRIRIKE